MIVSLRGMSMLSIAISLWEQDEMKHAFMNYHLYKKRYYTIKWSKLISRVIANIMLLSLPDSIKLEIAHVVKAVGNRICMWMVFTEDRLKSDAKFAFPHHKYWTPQGTIDGPKLFRALLREKKVKATISSYMLASEFCLENEMVSLWKELSENDRSILINNNFKTFHCNDHLTFMFYHMKNDFNDLLMSLRETFAFSSNESDLKYRKRLLVNSIQNENLPAVKYFWSIFNEAEKNETIIVMLEVALEDFPVHSTNILYVKGLQETTNHKMADIFIYFLSEVSEDRRDCILATFLQQKEYALGLYNIFLTWPWKDFFIPIFYRIYSTVQGDDYQELLDSVIKTNNKRLILEIWGHCSKSLKISESEEVLFVLFKARNISNFNMILNDSALINHRDDILHKLYNLVNSSNLLCDPKYSNFTEKFMNEVLRTEEERTIFQELH